MQIFWVDYDLRILRPFCFRSLFSRSFGLSACRVRTISIPHRVTAHTWHAATTCSGTNLKSSRGLNVLMKPSVSAGSPAKGCASPSSSPAQLSCFQPFAIFPLHSLAAHAHELLMGMQHATRVHGTASHSPDGLYTNRSRWLSVTVIDKEIEEKQRDLASPSANPTFTPHCCLPCRHV